MASILRSPITPERAGRGHAGRVWLAVGALVVAGWAYLVAMAWGMAHMDVSGDWLLMPRMAGWGAADLGLVFVMWAVMMAAMMLPSAIPLLVMLYRIDRADRRHPASWRGSARFAAGYLSVWTAFSLLATLAQWGLLEARLVSPMMDSASAYFSAALLFLAGAYQFSPWKTACLRHCRSPLGFLLAQDANRRFRLGLVHGSYCAGCCWLLMALLFVLGVMNLLWIAMLSALVFLEKCLPDSRRFSQLTGLGLLAWGIVLLLGAAGA